MIKVRAKRKYYYNHKLMKPGDVFFISDEKHFSEKSMARLDGKSSEPSPDSEPELSQDDEGGDSDDVI